MDDSEGTTGLVTMVTISINFKGTDYQLTVDETTANVILNDQEQAEKYLVMAFPELNKEQDNDKVCGEAGSSKKKVWFSKGKPTKDDEEATSLLLELRQKYDYKFSDKKTTNNSVWALIAKELEAQGFDICPTKEGPLIKCRQKFMNMEKQYIAYISHLKRTGEEKKSPPPYFDMLHAILEKKDKIQPKRLEDTEDSHEETFAETVSVASSSSQVSELENEEDTQEKNKKIINRFANIKNRVKPRSNWSSELLHTITKQHEQEREDRAEIKQLLKEQNEQRRQMVDLFGSLVRHVKKSSGPRKRQYSSSESE